MLVNAFMMKSTFLCSGLAAFGLSLFGAGKLLAEEWKPLFTNAKGELAYKQILIRDNGVTDLASKKIAEVGKSTLKMYPNWKEDKVPFALIHSELEYENYELKFEFKWGEKRFIPKHKAKKGSGLLYAIHDLENRKSWPSSMELQVQNGDVGDLWILNSYATPLDQEGKAITIKDPERFGNRAAKYADNEKEDWNEVKLVVKGADAQFYVNGKLVNSIKDTKSRDEKKSPLLRGNIGFQAEGAEVEYRNIMVKSLKK